MYVYVYIYIYVLWLCTNTYEFHDMIICRCVLPAAGWAAGIGDAGRRSDGEVAQTSVGAKDRTPQKSSWIFSGSVQWMFSSIFQRNFTCQWYFPKDCHLSSGFVLELSNGCSVAFMDFHDCDIWCVIVCPDSGWRHRWLGSAAASDVAARGLREGSEAACGRYILGQILS